MKIQLNGTESIIDEGLSVKSLLDQKKINFNTVACELNLKVLRRAELEKTFLKEGDILEVIRMIGGG